MVMALFMAACQQKQTLLLIEAENAAITYSGRMAQSKSGGVDLTWSGSSVSMVFEGDSLFAELKDEKGENYFNVIIDDDSIRVLKIDSLKRRYLLAAGLSDHSHKVALFKRTEWHNGRTTFYNFQLKGAKPTVSKIARQSRKMEFYGNSITAGYAVEDTTGMDAPDSTLTNHYLSYAAVAARHFNADSHSICKSGIGVMVSWFPLIMPEMYDREIPEDSTSQWEFERFTPQVVVVNLFQNDSWLIEQPAHPQFKARFGTDKPTAEMIVKSYQEFIAQIRTQYPKASIICLLGNMDITRTDSLWPLYVTEAVSNMSDENIFTLTVPYKETSGHPSVIEQQLIADHLIAFIEKNIPW